MKNIIFTAFIVFCMITVNCSGKVKDSASDNFHDGGDGTVTDLTTGFIWQKSDVKKTWEEANIYCEGLDYANHKDWRLPSIEELKTIVDSNKSPVMIDPIAFPDTKPMIYWSATTAAMWDGYAHVVDFSNGSMFNEEKTFKNYVRCVRQGQ